MTQNSKHTPLRSEGRGANSFLVTTWPLFNPTKRPVLGCFGAIFPAQKTTQNPKFKNQTTIFHCWNRNFRATRNDWIIESSFREIGIARRSEQGREILVVTCGGYLWLGFWECQLRVFIALKRKVNLLLVGSGHGLDHMFNWAMPQLLDGLNLTPQRLNQLISHPVSKHFKPKNIPRLK